MASRSAVLALPETTPRHANSPRAPRVISWGVHPSPRNAAALAGGAEDSAVAVRARRTKATIVVTPRHNDEQWRRCDSPHARDAREHLTYIGRALRFNAEGNAMLSEEVTVEVQK